MHESLCLAPSSLFPPILIKLIFNTHQTHSTLPPFLSLQTLSYPFHHSLFIIHQPTPHAFMAINPSFIHHTHLHSPSPHKPVIHARTLILMHAWVWYSLLERKMRGYSYKTRREQLEPGSHMQVSRSRSRHLKLQVNCHRLYPTSLQLKAVVMRRHSLNCKLWKVDSVEWKETVFGKETLGSQQQQINCMPSGTCSSSCCCKYSFDLRNSLKLPLNLFYVVRKPSLPWISLNPLVKMS